MEFTNKDRKYLELAEKWLNNTITPHEEIEFSEWYNANQDNVVMLSVAFAENEEILRNRILQNIQYRKEKDDKVISLRRYSFIRVAAAAAILILLTGGAWYYFYQKPEAGITKNNSDTNRFKNDIDPGSDKAVLTLADGSEIILDNAQTGTLTQQGNTKIILLDAGQLAYNTHGTKANGEVLYNTISTPKGGQYQIVLADGSKVWMNAASSLRFPTAFAGKQRNVELTGEAYFEVAKNAAMPFNVQVNDLNVQVLGTHFNVMAYNDENVIKTTLLEGAVKVTKGTVAGLLKPGQQAKMDKDAGNIKIATADVEETMAWKNGLFLFNNDDIKTIMRQISRWYDVNISFEGNIPAKNFTWQISRNTNVSQVLKMLELTKEVHFKITGKNIVVMP